MPRYKMKKGVGPHKYRGKWLHSGDIVECEESEIDPVLAKFEELHDAPPVEADPEPKTDKTDDTPDPPKRTRGTPVSDAVGEPAPTTNVPTVGLVLSHAGGGRYNVVNPESGKKINDDYLTKADAEAMLRKSS